MKAWLELFRISNLPTVWTNLAAGMAIGWKMTPDHDGSVSDIVMAIVFTLVAASCLYSGGMVLNDVFDHQVDREERPQRPIPSGRISLSAAIRMSGVLLLGGVGLAALAGQGGFGLPVVAILIAAFTFLYNALHGRTAWSILFLAVCRGLLYPMGVFAIHPVLHSRLDGTMFIILGLVVLVVMIHTISLSMVARNEMGPASAMNRFNALGTFALAGPGLILFFLMLMLVGTEKSPFVFPWPFLGILLPVVFLVLWLVRNYRLLQLQPPRVTGFVLGSIAAFPIFDALFLAMLPGYWTLLGLLGLAVFVIVRLMHRRIPGT